MDDRLKESISALMDDEANELELQRLLSHANKDEVLDTWASYHRIRTVLQNGQDGILNIDISQSVSEMIAQEESLQVKDTAHQESFESDLPNNLMFNSLNERKSGEDVLKVRGNAGFASRVSGGLAIAASVVFAVVFVLQNNIQSKLNISNTPLASLIEGEYTDANTTLVNASNEVQRKPKMIVEFSEAHARRFNEYLLRHAEFSLGRSPAGMMPLVRVASVNSVGI